MADLIAAIAVGCLVAGACSDDSGDRARTLERDETTTTTGSEPGADEDATTSTSQDPGESSPAADALVRIEDLPPGWSLEEGDGDDELDDEDFEFCEGHGLGGHEPIEHRYAGFVQGELGPFLSSVALLFDSDGTAASALDAVAEAAEVCQETTEVDDDVDPGEADEGELEEATSYEPLAFPALGDDAFAVRIVATSAFGPLTTDLVIIRDGPFLLSVAHGGFGVAPDTELVESMARLMLDRT